MALRETQTVTEADLFRQQLVNCINLRYPLVQLAAKIDWKSCEAYFGGLYATGVGRPGHPIRLMVGLQLLKLISNLSDEEVVAAWVENPYWQYFCGEPYFRHAAPIAPSLMTGFRKRIGAMGGECILGLTVASGIATQTVAQRSLALVNVDTTVQDKAVAFPTDACLLQTARLALVRQADQLGVKLRQSCARVEHAAFVRKTHGHLQQQHFSRLLPITRRIHSQPRTRNAGDPPKIYSVHALEVECIAKGKVHKPYEFGVKVGIVSTSKERFVIGAKALPSNPYDGHTLKECLEQAQRIAQASTHEADADRGYRGHGCGSTCLKVWLAGAKRGVTAAIQRKLKRRNAIEPVIGHMKSDGRLARNFLQGEQGNAMNVRLCAAGYNLRKILKKLRLLCAQLDLSLRPFLLVFSINPAQLYISVN